MSCPDGCGLRGVINLYCSVMEDGGLSKLDTWCLVNVILRLYKVIANCYDLCHLYVHEKKLLTEKWNEKDREIVGFFREPQRYEYGTETKVELSGRTFEELHRFIIERNDFALAMDFIQPKLYLTFLIKTMKKVEACLGKEFSCFDFVVLLRDFRAEIYKWAAVCATRNNTTLEKEMAKRQIMTYSILCDPKYRGMILREEKDGYPGSEGKRFDLADFFIQGYDTGRINRIFQYLNSLNEQKEASYIARMASVIAIAWEKHLLCETYGNTLQAVFEHFGISEKIENYKPARLRRSSYKGNPPLARVQALNFFQSLEGTPSGQ